MIPVRSEGVILHISSRVGGPDEALTAISLDRFGLPGSLDVTIAGRPFCLASVDGRSTFA